MTGAANRAVSTGWDDLAEEFAAWRGAGRQATLWWRDDDATRPSPALERVLGFSAATGVPVALAVIPRDAGDDLVDRLATAPEAEVLQHGFAHANHAGDDQRPCEYGPERPLAIRIAELAHGWRLISRFRRPLPVLVAPWNRLDEALIPVLPAAGLGAVSTLGPRRAAAAAPGVRAVNVHVDIMDWQTRRFAGLDAALGQLAGHLRARRTGAVDGAEPTGVMSHHAFHDEEAWSFLAALFAFTRERRDVRWLTAREAFWP
jgi:hypothetical protein